MTDRELLELAAKAYWGDEIDEVCSIEWDEYDQCIAYTHADNQDHNGDDRTFLWNPLTDDGDALRLAVKLELEINTSQMAHWGNNTYISDIRCRSRGITGYGHVPHRGDPYAATRRAIVRAAAEIGKQMQPGD